MNEAELRKECGLKPTELVNTNLGYLDIFKVENDIVYYGFLASGMKGNESVLSFIHKLKTLKGK